MTDYEGHPAYHDGQGRPMWVDDFPCSCCGELVTTNAWSFFGNGVRCPTCRQAKCVAYGRKNPPVRRCGRESLERTFRQGADEARRQSRPDDVT